MKSRGFLRSRTQILEISIFAPTIGNFPVKDTQECLECIWLGIYACMHKNEKCGAEGVLRT